MKGNRVLIHEQHEGVITSEAFMANDDSFYCVVLCDGAFEKYHIHELTLIPGVDVEKKKLEE